MPYISCFIIENLSTSFRYFLLKFLYFHTYVLFCLQSYIFVFDLGKYARHNVREVYPLIHRMKVPTTDIHTNAKDLKYMDKVRR